MPVLIGILKNKFQARYFENGQTNTFEKISTKEGISSNCINTILMGKDLVWFISNNGINELKIDTYLNKIKEVGFSKRWDTVTSWVDKNSAEYKWWEVKVFDNCFNNVPYGTLVACCEKWADGYPRVKNIDDMIKQLYVLLWTTTDPDRKAQLEGQIAFLKDLQKDPSNKDILNAAFVSMGLKYDEIADPSNATKTANEKIAATVKEKEEQAKKDAEAKAAKDKEAKEKKEKARTVDTSDPNVTDLNSKSGTKTTEKIDTESKDPNAKLDRNIGKQTKTVIIITLCIFSMGFNRAMIASTVNS